MQAVAAVVQDSRVTLRGRACAAGCLKLYMARTPQVCLHALSLCLALHVLLMPNALAYFDAKQARRAVLP